MASRNDDDRPIAERIIALERGRADALVSGDIDGFADLLTEDCVYIHASGRVDDKASYVAAQRSGTNRFLRFEYEDLRVRVFGAHVAVLTGRMRNWVRTGDETKMNDHRIQSVWVRREASGDDWKFASYCAAAIAASR